MRITCATEKGGCGQKFEVTDALLTAYKTLLDQGNGSSCLNPACTRRLNTEDIRRIVSAVEATKTPWPNFPLHRPLTPDGRRKSGVAPGVNFREIGAKELDRPPSPEEITRVQRFFARGLEEGIDCPCCTRHAQRQYRSLGCGPARWLIELVFLSDAGQAVHTGEILKGLQGNSVSGSDATSVLPLYGLIEAAEDPSAGANPPPPSSRAHAKGRTSGYWRPTKLGRAFALDKIQVPERVVTCLGVPEAFEGNAVSIKEALGKKFNFDEIMMRKKPTNS